MIEGVDMKVLRGISQELYG